jgi:putative addiction module CopG family antidote
MPNIDLGDPYESYVKGLIGTGLYNTYAEVVKDALRMHMNKETPSKQMAVIHHAIAEGEDDIKAGRMKAYSSEMLRDMTDEVINE